MAKELVLTLPGPDQPGYLKRARGLASFGKLVTQPASLTPEQADEAVDWLVSIVDEPKDKRKARELILNLSANQLSDILNNLSPAADPNS